MNILLVGNIVKDVYLNLDNRTEHFETDKTGTKWLDLSFNASKHHFFNRTTSLGGAAVSLEVLQKLGLTAQISGSNLNFADDDQANDMPETVSAHRYILISDENPTYFAPSTLAETKFTPPAAEQTIDYLYVDRSAKLTPDTVSQILDFLESSPRTQLVVFVHDFLDDNINLLLPHASLAFIEKTPHNDSVTLDALASAESTPDSSAISDALISENTPVNDPADDSTNDSINDSTNDSTSTPADDSTASSMTAGAPDATPVLPLPDATDTLSPEKIILISENRLSYLDISEHFTPVRADLMTHLSVYSVAAATILGCFILGFSVEKSLRLAKLNIEYSKLNSTLSLEKLQELSENPSHTTDLELIAASLLMPGKGILAADESGGSIQKKFAQLDIPDTYDNRQSYRNLFFSTPNLADFVNGVILFDETARGLADNGQNVVDFLTSERIIPGIKVDQGLENFPDSDETFTKGLDGLSERLQEYHQMSLRFAKWRAAFEIRKDENGQIITPTDHAITENCRILAEYAAACQAAGFVPIVEPEVVHAGDYSITECAEVTARILDQLFQHLYDAHVNLRACILKTNMILAGKQFAHPSTPDEVGTTTAEVLKNHVPAELAGIVFLSGGQTPEQATANLAAVIQHGPFPWPVTFSFARALQDPALYAWAGDPQNSDAARDAFRARLEANTAALYS